MSDQVVELKPKNGRPRKTEFTRLTKKQNDFVQMVTTMEGQLTLREIAQKSGLLVERQPYPRIRIIESSFESARRCGG